MKSVVFLSAWLFIFLAAAYDSHFAWHHQDDMVTWEVNPLARALAEAGGIVVVLGMKASGLIFAGAVALYCRRLRHRLTMPLTLVISCFYVFLSLHYYLSSMQPPGSATTAVASRFVP